MSNGRSISVIIPAYNAAEFIIEALESICKQTLLPLEVLVINDGSTDNTRGVIESWLEKVELKFAVHFFNQENQGLPNTRNRGIKKANGEWIALLDADDIWEPEHLQVLHDGLELVPTAVASYGAGRVLTEQGLQELFYDDFWGNPSKKFGIPINTKSYLIDRKILPTLFKGNFIKPSSLLFSRKIADDISLFNEQLKTCEDREFLIRLITKGNFVYSADAITQYRWHEDNISQHKNAKKNLANTLLALSAIRENKSLQLSAKESSALKTETKLAIKEFLYVCAEAGWKDYKEGFGFVKNLHSNYLNTMEFLHINHVIRTFLCKLPWSK